MEDQLIRVDLYDKEIGYGTKEEIHRKGQLHRAFSVFLVDDDRMLIQKRREDKYHSGGLWANACCSHPRRDESLEDAIERRLQEELGVTAPCRELSHFVYYMKFSDEMHEYELDHIFLGTYDGEVDFDRNEIEEVKWVDFDWLEDDMEKNPDHYACWFLIAAPKVLEFLRD
ncbi:MAG: isopentenyl-diphosphate Delta-isomerase [Lachnospiraceae bacterium]|nr:isopentenyl-diphosphate Delta-isomerase [Lachnospiraceae bacterium]MDY4971844.1 isopentenyl-diphosphate Delta-isomerase [Lachnospiraceae bacterium]